MHEVTDGTSYKRPQTTGADAATAINDRNKEIKNLLDDPEATSVAPTPVPAPPTPQPSPKETLDQV